MQVSQPNNVKIYNLSAGKSLPEWLSERKKRTLQKNDINIRRRIELLQDFEMPTASTNVRVSADKQYIMASGVYKPRIRCYDTSELCMKFERCLDSEIVKFHILSEDYSKMVFLTCDRHVEFHAQYGRYYRTRIPKFGRDLVYHYPSCDLYLVGASSEVYRLNLEQGRFLNSLQTNAVEINTCDINPVHQLFAAGTAEFFLLQVLLYDLRSTKPLLVKDHRYGLPINSVAFQDKLDVVLSSDSKILKIWDRETGKPFTSIEPPTDINDLCSYPDSGLVFMATESPKMLVYYIPALGPAPRWCSFLDNLTEELEEDQQPTVYDDYKFVTKQELESLGLSHLMGTNLLRAYMHGYFIDIRLYHKAKSLAEPFAFEEYRRKRIQDKIEEERANRVKLKKLPKVNRNLAEKLMDEKQDKRKEAVENSEVNNPLGDDRFSAMFSNPDFQVDEESQEFKLLHPVVSKHDRERQKKQRDWEKQALLEQFDEVEEPEGRPSEEEESSSSEDEREWRMELKKQQKEAKMNEEKPVANKPKFYELKSGENFRSMKSGKSASALKDKKISLGERLLHEQSSGVIRSTGSSLGEKEITFQVKKSNKEKQRNEEIRAHVKERKRLRRSATSVLGKEKRGPVFWRGRRVR
ncbi:nucleolar protein 10-like [Pocillopora damicornis]|uniref:nucleolar protein 10-like n=1 Tax=Pocillopora damicornis TaxID=46731 RepID=UPI000F5518E7|nr:nucleolar protein 10-like [Pocillopora damicornis]